MVVNTTNKVLEIHRLVDNDTIVTEGRTARLREEVGYRDVDLKGLLTNF